MFHSLFQCVFLFLYFSFATVNSSNDGVPSFSRQTLGMEYKQGRKAQVGVEIFNNTLYAIGGYDADTTINKISYIDIDLLLTTSSNDNWDVYIWQSDTSTGVTYSYDDIRVSGSVIVDNLIYITGTHLTEMLVFDASRNTQKLFNTYNFTMPESASATALMSCAVTNETHIFVIGGRDITGTYRNSTTKLQIYDIFKDEWYYGDNMNIRRSSLDCHYDEINNKIWVTGGATYGKYYTAGWTWWGVYPIEYYDILNDKWHVINNSMLTYRRVAHYGALWTFPYNTIENLYNNEYGISDYSSHFNKFPKYNKQFIFIAGGFNGLATTESNWLYQNEIFEINNNENNVSSSKVLPYDGLNDVSSLHAIGLTNARWLPSEYDTVELTITQVNSTHEQETILIEKQFVSVGARRPTASPFYQSWIFLTTVNYQESIYREIETSNMPSIVPSNTPSNEPSVEPTANPNMDPTNVPSGIPTTDPNKDASMVPSIIPSREPIEGKIPSIEPTVDPTNSPRSVSVPSVEPSVNPSAHPTNVPSDKPSAIPNNVPSTIPTIYPTKNPSKVPSTMPSKAPIEGKIASIEPTNNPRISTIDPSNSPSSIPSATPFDEYLTVNPTKFPSDGGETTVPPSKIPSNAPSKKQPPMHPSLNPTLATIMPTSTPVSRETTWTTQDQIETTTNNNNNNNNNNNYPILGPGDCKYVKFRCVFGCFWSNDKENKKNNRNNNVFYFNPGVRTVFELEIEMYLTNTETIKAFENAKAGSSNNNNNNNNIMLSLGWNIHGNWDGSSDEYASVISLLGRNFTLDGLNNNNNQYSMVTKMNEMIDGYTNLDILMYDKFNLNIFNQSYGMFVIKSKIVFYQSQMDRNVYSYDILYDINKYINGIFDINEQYKLENEISLYYDNELMIYESDDVNLTANAPITVVDDSDDSTTNDNSNIYDSNTIYVDCNVEPSSINHDYLSSGSNDSYDSYDLGVSCIFTNVVDFNNTFANLIFDDALCLFDQYQSLFEIIRETDDGSLQVSLSKSFKNTPIADGDHSIKLIVLDDMDIGTLYYESSTMTFNSVINKDQFNDDTIESIMAIMLSYEVDNERNEEIEFVLAAGAAYQIIMEQENNILYYEFMELVINFTSYNVDNNYLTMESNEMNYVLELLNTVTETTTSTTITMTIDQNIDILLLLQSIVDEYDHTGMVISENSADLVISVLYNVMESLTNVVVNDIEDSKVGDLISNLVISLGNVILETSVVGESYYFSEYLPLFEIKYAKIDENNYDECQINKNVDLQYAKHLLNSKSNNGSNDINCIIMNTQYNMYNNNNNNNNGLESYFILFELINDNITEESDSRYELASCEPILLSFNASKYGNDDDLDDKGDYALCLFYNKTSEMYDSNGCYLLYNNDTRYVCACLHLAYFGVSSQDFEIRKDYQSFSPNLNDIDWADVIIPISVLILVIVTIWLVINKCAYACCLVKPEQDMALWALSNEISDQEKSRYRSRKEYVLRNGVDDKWDKRRDLWISSLRNDHIWFGICCRDYGTNYTSTERSNVLILCVLITMAILSVCYAVRRRSSLDDYYGIAIVLVSLLASILVFAIKCCFEKSKPKLSEKGTVIPSEDNYDNDETANRQNNRNKNNTTENQAKNNDNDNDNDNVAGGDDNDNDSETELKVKDDVAGNNVTSLNGRQRGASSPAKSGRMAKEVKPLCARCRDCACLSIAVLALICVGVITLSCAYFNASWKYHNNYENVIDSSQCVDNIDISYEIWLNYHATNDYIEKLSSDNNKNSDNNFWASSFLLATFFGHLMTALCWEPIIALLCCGCCKINKYCECCCDCCYCNTDEYGAHYGKE